MRLLHIDSSARKSSVSRELTAGFVEMWKRANPMGEVVVRDLAVTPLPLPSDEWRQGAFTDPEKRTPAQHQALEVSDALIDEIVSANEIVIGAPMYNFTIPSTLKAWIDQIVRIGKTFAYYGNGPKGLLEGKKVVVITSRGGAYRPWTPTAGFDFQEPYLRHILGFIGLSDVTFIHAENQSNEELAGPARADALERIGQVVGNENTPVSLPMEVPGNYGRY
jgi:FMN-dependent NADH-azoreductase